MTGSVARPRTDSDREAIVARAAEAISQGRLVVLPTETVYGVAASAAREEALRSLKALRSTPASIESLPTSAWHAPSVAAVRANVPLTSPVHRRILDRLLPGPVRIVIEVGEDRARDIVAKLGAIPGTFDRAGALAIRVPANSITADILLRVGAPVVIDRLSTPGPAGRAPSAEPAGVALVVDDGPTPYSKPSSTILLNRAGGYRILSEGALDAKAMNKRIERHVLFVCTGNTCRSPMAEAIARGLTDLEQARTPRVTLRFQSAGAAATEGAPVSPETFDVLDELGFPPPTPRSRELTREMIDSADVIYAMSNSHRRAILSLAPEAAEKTHLLDPDGDDIQDPIGGPLSVYRETAQAMKSHILQRLKELEALDAR